MSYNGDYVAQMGMVVAGGPTVANVRILDHPRILYGGRLMPDGRADRNPEMVVSISGPTKNLHVYCW